jgi:hypothetical protein
MKTSDMFLGAAAVVGLALALGAMKKANTAPTTPGGGLFSDVQYGGTQPSIDLLYQSNTSQSNAVASAAQAQQQQDLKALASSEPNWWAEL